MKKFLVNHVGEKSWDIVGGNISGLNRSKFVELTKGFAKSNAPIISKAARNNANGSWQNKRRTYTRSLQKLAKELNSAKHKSILNNIVMEYIKTDPIQRMLNSGARPQINIDMTSLEKVHVGLDTAFEDMKPHYSGTHKEEVPSYPCIVSTLCIGKEKMLLNFCPVLYESKNPKSKDFGNERIWMEKEMKRLTNIFQEYGVFPHFVVDSALDNFGHQLEIDKNNLNVLYRLGYSRGIVVNDNNKQVEEIIEEVIDQKKDIFEKYLEDKQQSPSKKEIKMKHKGIECTISYGTTWTHKKYYDYIDCNPHVLQKDKSYICEKTIVISFTAKTYNQHKNTTIERKFAAPINLLTLKTYKQKMKKKKAKRAGETKEKDSRCFFVIATNNLSLDGKKMLRMYRKRWQVETQIKEMKDRDNTFHITGFRTFKFKHTKIMILASLLTFVSICHLKLTKGVRWICRKLSSAKHSFEQMLKDFEGIKNVVAKIKRKYFEAGGG